MPVNERVRQLTFDVFEWATPKGYRLEIENQENLRVLNEHPEDPAVLFFNHLAKDDPFLAQHMVKVYAEERLDNLIIPISEWYSHFYNHPAYATFVFLGRELGNIEMPEVIQSYETRGSKKSESFQNLKDISGRKGDELPYFLDRHLPGGPLIILAPEGHRSDDGALLPSEKGVGLIVKRMERLRNQGMIENGYFIPLGLVFQKYRGPKIHYNPVSKPEISLIVGEPLSVDAVIEGTKNLTEKVLGKARTKFSSLSHFLMWNLSTLLPEEMAGVYGPDKLKDTLLGRNELRIKGGRHKRAVGLYDKWNEEFFDAGDIPKA